VLFNQDASEALSNFGLSIAGMPSLGGPPENIFSLEIRLFETSNPL